MISNYFKIAPAFIVTTVVFLCGCLLLLNSLNVKANIRGCREFSTGNAFPPTIYRYPAVVKSKVNLLSEPAGKLDCSVEALSTGAVVYVIVDSSNVSGWVFIGSHSGGNRGHVPRNSIRRIPESAIGPSINKRQIESANPKLKAVQSKTRLMSQQQILHRLGYAPGPIDGILGPLTISATKQFQNDNDLGVDGVIGPKTLAALNSADKNNSRNGSLRDFQSRLKELGFDPGPIDGLPGPRTTAAIVQFQRSRNLVADGILGPITKRALVSG